jgi:hypothetical protein
MALDSSSAALDDLVRLHAAVFLATTSAGAPLAAWTGGRLLLQHFYVGQHNLGASTDSWQNITLSTQITAFTNQNHLKFEFVTLYNFVSNSPSESCSWVVRQYLLVYGSVTSLGSVSLVTDLRRFMLGWKMVCSSRNLLLLVAGLWSSQRSLPPAERDLL